MGTMNVYYTTLPDTNWKLMIQIPQAELNKPVNRLVLLLTVVCVLAVVLSIFTILLQVNSISKGITKVQSFASALAEGDFSVDPITVHTQDELGVMSDSLNEMYNNNKEVIQKIAEHSSQIGEAGKQLRDASSVLAEQFASIHSYMNEVNEAMHNTSAAAIIFFMIK